MISYRDKTFCASPVHKEDCRRQMTEEEEKHASALGLPVAYAFFCDPPTEEDA